MKKSLLIVLTLIFSFLPPLVLPGQAAPAGDKPASVAILPFQINAGEDSERLRSELPALFAQRLAARGFRVIPQSETLNYLQKNKINEINLLTARNVAARLRADHVLYGSYTQTGQAFSIDTRFADAGGNTPARPFYAEKKSLVELYNAVDEMSGAMAGASANRNAIAGVRIRGLRVLDEDVVLMRLSTRAGDLLDPAAVNEEVRRIWDLGYFSDVSADLEESGEGRLLVFTVKEKPRIEDVVVNGSDAVRKDEILAVMSSKTGSVINDRIMAQDLQKITELYRKEGYYLAEVKSRVEERADGTSALLVFDVVEGNKLYIRNIRLEGLETLDPDDLKEELALSERGMFSWITGSGVLRDEYLDRDSAALTAYGLNNGYMDIKVSAPQVDYEKDGIDITFGIEEGPRYKVGDVTFAGDLVDTDERLAEVIKLDDLKTTGDGYFALSVMQDDIKALADFYSNFGYAFAQVDVDTTKDMANDTINVTFVIDKKQKVHVRRAMVEGNTRTRDNVIFRELRLADGEPFSGERLRRSNERLNHLRYFKQIDITTPPTDRPDEVDLLIRVEEDRTGQLSFGAGYHGFYEFMLSANIMERNLFGRGYYLGLNGILSGRSSTLNLSFTNPHLFDSNLGFSENVYGVWEEWDDFRKKTVGNTIRLFHPIGEYSSVSLGYRLDRYTLYSLPYNAPHSYKEYEGRNLSSVVSVGYSYDSTDSYLLPTRGFRSQLFVEYGGGGLGGNDNFFKPTFELQGFRALWRNPAHVFHWRGKVGAVYKNSNKSIPVFDRFFIGGINSNRGYKVKDLTPLDPIWGDQIGSDRIGFVNLEYIWNFEKDMGLSLVPFFDIGFAIDSEQISDPFKELKSSVGLELRWNSPMGPLRFSYGYPLDSRVDGGRRKEGNFEFAIDQPF